MMSDAGFIERLGVQLDTEYREAQRKFMGSDQGLPESELKWGTAKWHEMRVECDRAGKALSAFYDKFPDLRPVYGYDIDFV